MLHRFSKTTLIAGLLISGVVHASGYEKAIMWGGRSAGLAGIASPYVQGPESLFFNPAGLVSDKVSQGIDLNISAFSSQFKGPIDDSNTQKESKKALSTPFGLMYGKTPTERFGFGVGGYISAGSMAEYDNITIGTASDLSTKSELTVAELAFGAGYKVTDKLKVGVAYRILMATGEFAFIQRAAGGAINAKVTDLKGMNFTGYKVGAQYALSENTQLGLSYRSNVDLTVKGKLGGTMDHAGTGGTTVALDNNDATATTSLPQALTIGALQKMGEHWNLMGEFVWTQYSRVDHVTLDGALTRGATVVAANAPDLEQSWHDQYQVKLAGEYLGMSMPIRLGYLWTSQVTNDDYARATFVPPGIGHTFTLGTGMNLGESFRLDGAFDYTFVKGKGNGAAAGATAGDIRAGEHEVTAYTLNMALSYAF